MLHSRYKTKRAGTEKATTKLVPFFNDLCLFTVNIEVAAIIMIIINSIIMMLKVEDLARSFIIDLLYSIFISLSIYTYSLLSIIPCFYLISGLYHYLQLGKAMLKS